MKAGKIHVYVGRSLDDFSAAAKSLKEAMLDGDFVAASFAASYGINPTAPLHTQLLDALAAEAGLSNWETARRVLPETTIATATVVEQIHSDDAQRKEESARNFRFFPDRAFGEPVDLQVPFEQRLVSLASGAGFRISHATNKKLELANDARRQVVYLDRTRIDSKTIAVIVPPWSELAALSAIEGLQVPSVERYYHSSNCRVFPRHEHRGKNSIPFGYSIVCATEGAYSRLLQVI